jgi:tetraacyldisaccharide 4'-kinase
MYRNGVFKQLKLDVPVISVGNLVLGGTGKTPLVMHIARLLQKRGRKPAILSRGYKGKAAAEINIVSDDSRVILDAVQAGDEPRLLAEKLPGIPVVTGKRRTVTGRHAIDNFRADSLILDDGFQHLALQRDLDLVLFSADTLLGNGRVMPGGELREPLSALKRADAFIISGVEQPLNEHERSFVKLLNTLFPDTPVFTGSYQAEETLLKATSGKQDTISLQEARRSPLYGFCGIARPESFRRLLEQNGMDLAGFEIYKDHHSYSTGDIKSLADRSNSAGTQTFITTEKDYVKVREMLPDGFSLLALPLVFQMGSGFNSFIAERLENIECTSELIA